MTNVQKDLLRINVQISTTTDSMPLEHTVWLEAMLGSRIEVVCPWCRKSFLLAVPQVQANAAVRCWHCHEKGEAISALCEAHPGLELKIVRPATDRLLSEIEDMFKGFK